MWIISKKALRQFWQMPKNEGAKKSLIEWHQVVADASWRHFADVKQSYNSVDRYGNKTIFDVGGNKYRIIAVIDFELQKVFIRAVMDHKEYDKGKWKKDNFGENWESIFKD